MTRIVNMLFLASLLVCLATGAPAEQQAPGPRSGAAPRGPAGGQPTEQQREAVRKKVEAVRLARMTEELQLDEKTAAKFIPLITALDQKRRALVRENRETMREIKIMLQGAQPDEAKLKVAVGSIEKNRREIFALRDKEFIAAKDSLTVTQMARYVLFNQEFQQEMRGMMAGARGRAPQGGMGPGPGPGRGPGRVPGPGPQQP